MPNFLKRWGATAPPPASYPSARLVNSDTLIYYTCKGMSFPCNEWTNSIWNTNPIIYIVPCTCVGFKLSATCIPLVWCAQLQFVMATMVGGNTVCMHHHQISYTTSCLVCVHGWSIMYGIMSNIWSVCYRANHQRYAWSQAVYRHLLDIFSSIFFPYCMSTTKTWSSTEAYWLQIANYWGAL